MPHSNFKRKVTDNGARVRKCDCSQTFECATEQELAMKFRIYRRFCSNLPLTFDKIGFPKKACTLREQQLAEAKRMKRVHNKYLSNWINIITIPERNHEATLYLQELTSTLPIQKLSQVRLTGNTSHDYQGFR